MTRRHMSMLRSYTPADALTIGNAACGTIAIFLCLDYLAAGGPRVLWARGVRRARARGGGGLGRDRAGRARL